MTTEPLPAGAPARSGAPARLVIIGGGMAAQRLVESLRARDALAADPRADEQATGGWRITVLAEEPHAPYDRVALTSCLSGDRPQPPPLGDPALWQDPRIALHRGDPVTAIDRDTRSVTTRSGRRYGYDALVLATGSEPFVPPVPGHDLPGCFVYRTVDDVLAIREYVQQVRSARPGDRVDAAVVGGGLLGLEAAGALRTLGVELNVVEFASRLMPLQVDEGGGEALRRLVENLGVQVRTGSRTTAVTARATGPGAGAAGATEVGGTEVGGTEVGGTEVGGIEVEEGAGGPVRRLPADVVVFATGVRPRDGLARAAGLPVGPRGGVLIDDRCRTQDPRIWAIGEVACVEGRCLGLVAPAYAMAEVVADRLLAGSATFAGADLSTKLKLLGVDVASFGDAFATTPGALSVVLADPVGGTYKKLVLSDDATTLLGGVLVGDASAFASLRPLLGRAPGGDPVSWLLPDGTTRPDAGPLPDEAGVCSCNNVSAGTIRTAVREQGCTDLAAVKACTRAGASCGSCLPLVRKLLTEQLQALGVGVSNALCEHFDQSRAQLFDIVRVSGIRTFSALIARYGRGRGCDICRPVVASILASLGTGHVLDGEQATLQDSNDHVLANLQKDGSYSVVPRIPGGEITPAGLIAIGEVARDFDLYTKITGGQRIDLFGARIEQLPAIWNRLIEAGFESGHAYGKAVRTVKSCVGSTWCRYGVQDSVAMAIGLELRYRGLRSPHKIKLGVSGCARECAEARSKDVGVIATDHGWNLYVGGNGGFTPRHARLLAEDLDGATLIRTIDRFLMYYVRTADRLQRTAAWLEEIEGGLEQVRAVVLEDSLGIAADLDAAMAAHVDHYVDEWRATCEDPVKLRRFTAFVNAPDAAEAGRGHPTAVRPVPPAADPDGVDPGVDPDVDPDGVAVCRYDDLVPERGVAALVGTVQVALFRLHDGRVTAVDHRDPFSGAKVIARGIVGSRGSVPTVASPMYKQVFDLLTGRCLDEPSVGLATHPVRVDDDGMVRILPGAAS